MVPTSRTDVTHSLSTAALSIDSTDAADHVALPEPFWARAHFVIAGGLGLILAIVLVSGIATSGETTLLLTTRQSATRFARLRACSRARLRLSL